MVRRDAKWWILPVSEDLRRGSSAVLQSGVLYERRQIKRDKSGIAECNNIELNKEKSIRKHLFFAVLSVTAMLALTFSSAALDRVPSRM